MNLSNPKSRFLFATIAILAGFLVVGHASAQELPSFELPKIPAGAIEGAGTNFAITDSSYLTVALDSTETIKLRMESIPEMVTMMIEPVSSATSTRITLSGFLPFTTYYKYEDDYHNLTEFIADSNGVYSYTQDLSKAHLVFIQPRTNTKFIRDDATGGDCAKTPNQIGTWNAATKTCVLSMDLAETIQIDSNNIILDGNGRTITGSNTGNGVYLYGRSGVAIKNLNVRNFTFGIWIYYSDNVVISNISSINNPVGVIFTYSSYSTLSDSFIQAGSSPYITTGVSIGGNPSVKNKIIRNTITNTNYFGISISYSDDTLIENNTLLNNRNWGIGIYSNNNIISNNFISGSYTGIDIEAAYNKIFYNTIQANRSLRINGGYSTIYNNNFNSSPIVYGGIGNVYNLPLPIGGNYWSNYDTPTEGCVDINNDNFCDLPYVFSGGQDNLPWTKKDGWLTPQNNPHILSFPATGPYTGDGIDPNIGTANSTPFFFKIVYTDTDNDPPSNIALVIDNGTVSRHVMTVDTEASDTLRDGNYTNGEQYTFKSQFPRGDYRYYFEAADGINVARTPANDLPFRSGLIVAAKSSANIRSDRGTSASIIGTAQRGDPLELFSLCSEIGGTNCNDDALLYTLKDGHYWLKINWNNSIGFIAEDLVMTIMPENQPERVKKLMTEVFAQTDFTAIQSFPIELPLAIAAHESGGTLNNEITSVDSPFSGIMQVHPSTSGRNRNCVDNICNKIGDYWINIKNSFTDIFDISTNNKDDKVFMLKNYISTSYSNTDDGLKNNIFDGLKVLTDKYRTRCPKESIFWTDSASGTKYEITCADIEKIRAVWAYNGLVVDSAQNYLLRISGQLASIANVFPGVSYPNTDYLIEKLRLANDNKREIKKYSSIELHVLDTSGRIIGEAGGEIRDDIYNAIYDPSTESIGIFFPQDTYRYVVVGNATSTYGLAINSTNDATTTTFTATDVPVTPGAIHEYTVDSEVLGRGEEGVTIRIDENGDGVFEKTVVSDGELTQEEYNLQTKTVIDFDPDTFNIKSGNGKATVYIELSDGFDVGTIDMTTIKLNGVAALEKPTSVGDYDNDGIPNLMVKFDRSTIIKTLPQEGDSATIAITGKAIHKGNRLSFKGEDTIKIVGRK